MLTIVASHPVQYQTPIWRELARRGRVPIEVIYFCDHGCRLSYDREFRKSFAWDANLLDGYPWRFLHAGRSPWGFNSLHVAPETLGDLWRSKPKAVWIQGWQFAGYWETALAARAIGAKVWLRGETNLQSGNPNRRLLRRLALRVLFTRVSRFLVVGKANREFYEALGVSTEHMAFAPYCVDNESLRDAATAHHAHRSKIRDEWGIPDDAFCFLFVGKFIDKKRPLDIVEATEIARRRANGRKIHLVWVGDGALLARAKALCMAGFSGATNVTSSFIGFLNQSEIVKAYCAADCLILPSEPDETWGLVVNEAMACGLPAIISDACGCAADLRIEGFDELVFPVGDIEALARSMIAAMTRLPDAQTIRQKIDQYDMRRTVEAVEQLYLASLG